jgi:hypothetical protein
MKIESLVISRNPLFTENPGQLSGKLTISDSSGTQIIHLKSRAIEKALRALETDVRATAAANSYLMGDMFKSLELEFPSDDTF